MLLLAVLALASCDRRPAPDRGDLIAFQARQADLPSRAAAVTVDDLVDGGFYVCATTGSAGSEQAVFTNAAFQLDLGRGAFVSDRAWPEGYDPGYHFYASNVPMTHTADGPSVTVTTGTDVVCAVNASPTYKTVNALSFEHLFARLGTVTVAAGDGFTVSGIRILLTPCTGGTYHLAAGNGQTDGTGWSDLTTGSPVNIANETPGVQVNDLYLVPGTYHLSASWTASKSGYATQTVQDKSRAVQLAAGVRHDLTLTLSADQIADTP